jgi:hypothetical protein
MPSWRPEGQLDICLLGFYLNKQRNLSALPPAADKSSIRPKITVFWVVTACSLLDNFQLLGTVCYFHLQGMRVVASSVIVEYVYQITLCTVVRTSKSGIFLLSVNTVHSLQILNKRGSKGLPWPCL